MAPITSQEPYHACEPDADERQVFSAMPADVKCLVPAMPREPYNACSPDADEQQVSSAMPAELECQGSREGESPRFLNNAPAEHASFASGQLSAPDHVSPEIFKARQKPACKGPVTSPSGDMPGSGPLLIELCAGSANLSSVAAARGFSIMPVDHAFNRHRTKAKVVTLDLSKAHAWNILTWTIKHRDVAIVHAAPPCGTCSAARGIRLKDGSSGPPVLRTSEHPWGVPWASPRDKTKLLSANCLYKFLASFLETCTSLQIPWCVENPTNSSLWSLPCFVAAVASGHFAHCQACAFGSTRDKKTSFLCSHAAISRMAIMCPGCVFHEPWGQDASGAFNTSKEAEYPIPMCHGLCDVAEDVCMQRGLSLGSAKPVLARAFRQPRGRLRPQLIPEFVKVVSCVLRAMPALDAKRCLTAHVKDAPAGSKLLRSENRGSSGFFCVFGVFREPESFVKEALHLWHPFDSLAQLPDYLVRSLFEQLTLGPAELAKTRLNRLQEWRALASTLNDRERHIRSAMHPNVAKVLGRKRTALLETLAERIQWPDRSFFAELREGFRLVGNMQPTGVFRPGLVVASLSEEDLMSQSEPLKSSILGKLAREPPNAHSQELFDITMNEADEKGWLEGPYSPEEVSRMFSKWLPVRRFCVEQKGKLRPIDDFRENQLNSAFSSPERITLQAMDHLIWSMNVLCHYFRTAGAVDFVLSTGDRLSGEVHRDWANRKAAIKVSSLDLKSAYKQMPLHPSDYDKTVVCLKDPGGGGIKCFLMRTLPFGGAASVPHFLRASMLGFAGLRTLTTSLWLRTTPPLPPLWRPPRQC